MPYTPPRPPDYFSTPLTGVACALPAFLIWGLSPVYWKALQHVPPFEILMHRIVWSFAVLMPLVLAVGRGHEFVGAVKDRRIMSALTATTLIVGGNWFLFIWAINSGHVLQASMGYFINPLVNVLLGFIFLKERLRPLQILAVGLAACGVIYLAFDVGEFPWVALALAVSFGFYGLIRKVAPVSAMVGLTVETLLLALPAAAYLGWLDSRGAGAFLRVDAQTDLLLMGAALMTALPLLLFTLATRRLTFSTVGILQYLSPSCTFLLAVLVYHEPVARGQWLTFVLIWAALVVYSVDSIRCYRHPQALTAAVRSGRPAAAGG